MTLLKPTLARQVRLAGRVPEAAVSDQDLSRLLTSVPVPMAALDTAGRIRFVNQPFADRLGRRTDEARGASFTALLDPKDAEPVHDAIQEGLRNRASTVRADLAGPMGRRYPANLTLTPEADSLGRVTGVFLTISVLPDVGEAVRGGYLPSSIFDQSPSSIIITDRRFRIEYVNRMFERRTGFSAAEVRGRNPRFLASGYMTPNDYQLVRGVLESGETWIGQFHNRRKDGSVFWERAAIGPIRDESGTITHFLSVQDDITETKQAEIELEKAKESAEQGSRAKSQFLATMNHELRTPLNVIIGFSEMIRQEIHGPLRHRQYEEFVQDIHVSASNLLDLINDILSVSRHSSGKLALFDEETDVDRAVLRVVEMLHMRAVDAAVRVTVDLTPLPRLLADRASLRQMLVVLLSNAIKFTEPGGVVTIATARAEDGGVQIRVVDSGIGIPRDKLAEVRGAFVQADNGLNRHHEGAGLGLSICETLIGQHRGRLDLDSEEGRGTTATLWFPAERVLSDTPG